MHILRSARGQIAAAVVLFLLLLVAISTVAIWSAHSHQSRLRSLEDTSLAAATLEHTRCPVLLRDEHSRQHGAHGRAVTD
jgi:hypothetical protein